MINVQKYLKVHTLQVHSDLITDTKVILNKPQGLRAAYIKRSELNTPTTSEVSIKNAKDEAEDVIRSFDSSRGPIGTVAAGDGIAAEGTAPARVAVSFLLA